MLVCQLLAANAAFADCVEYGPICQHLWHFDAVFDGTARRIDRAIVLDENGRRLAFDRMVTRPGRLLQRRPRAWK
jgi:hypothetical protein